MPDTLASPFVTPQEAAAFLRVHTRTIYRWVREGRLRAKQIGPRVSRLYREDIDALARVEGQA